jgi:hypothetical protein
MLTLLAQMPIVDGLTSTKMIRSHEKISSSSPPQGLSERAALNGRIPIIAVSASLVERERQTYIDAGFDAWILKPISFDRLQTLLTGIVDRRTREECLYKPGWWEEGGWFDQPHADTKFEAKTRPDEGKESSALRGELGGQQQEVTVDGGAAEKGYFEEEGKKLRKEQERDLDESGADAKDIARPPLKSASAPAVVGGRDAGDDDEITPKASASITGNPAVDTPEPMGSPVGGKPPVS